MSFFRIVLLGALVASTAAVAGDAKDTARVAAVLARILGYEKTLSARANGRVDVVFVAKKGDAASEAEATDLEAALASLGTADIAGVPLRWTHVDAAPSALKEAVAAGADVFVFCRGTETDLTAALALAREKGVLSVGLTRAFAEKGTAVALDHAGESIKIIINGESLKAERIQFATQLLRVADVL